MTSQTSRALRVLVPSDLRLIWRDGFLLTFMVLVMPLACLLLRWLVPHIEELVSDWVALERYHGLILAWLLGQQPIVLALVVGILFVEERDQGTLLALRATPLSLSTFLGYRLVAAMLVSTAFTWLGLTLIGLTDVSAFELLVASALASLAAPIVALTYAVFMRNKVQAVMSGKLIQAWGFIPLALYFVPAPWSWLGALAAPLYYPMRLLWTAADGQPEWWLVVPALIVPSLFIAALLRRLRRVV